MKVQFMSFVFAVLIMLAGSPSYAQIAGPQSFGVIPAIGPAPIQVIQTPVITDMIAPMITPPVGPVLTSPVGTTLMMQPGSIVGQPGVGIANVNLNLPKPVIVTPLGSIQVQSLPGFFLGSFTTSSGPVTIPTPAR